MALSGTQLNATASVAGTTFAYSPAAGTVLAPGTQTLSVTFTPTDTANYTTASATTLMTVNPFRGPSYGGGWSGTVSGSTFTYNGVNYPIGNGRVRFPDCSEYIVAPNGALMSGVVLTGCTPVGRGPITPTITWATPAAVVVGTALSDTQLNASSGGVAGSFVYTPLSGTVMSTAGNQTLSVVFTPTDTVAYTSASASVTLLVTASGGGSFAGPANGGGWSGTISGSNLIYNGRTFPIVNGRVNFPDCTEYIVAPNGALMSGFRIPGCTPIGVGPITPTISWATPAAVVVGTALSGAQLNASSGGVAGTFVYTPLSGTVMSTAGNQMLSVAFTPTDTAAYTSASASVTVLVTASGGGGFVGPGTGGGWSGTISGSNLIYSGRTFPIVNGRVNFPDCTTFIVAPNGALIGGAATPSCTPSGGGPATPTITWATPAAVLVGTALSGTQLNASSGGVAGAFVYTPLSGTVMSTAGNQTLSVIFTPTDTAAYTSASASVPLLVTTSVFAGPANGGGWNGTISGSNLIYNGRTFPIVNGRVNFPDCTTYIVAPNGALVGGSATPNCTSGDRRDNLSKAIVGSLPLR